MKAVVTVSLVIVGIIHLLPLSGVLGAERLAALYGIEVSDPNLAILMRHRAVLFGLLGGFLIYAAFVPALSWLGIVAGFISVGSFLLLAATSPGYNDALRTVVIADMVALVLLVAASVARLRMV